MSRCTLFHSLLGSGYPPIILSAPQLVGSSLWNVTFLHQRFSRDQHELLIRQLYHIKQLSTVQDYIERFTELVEQLKAYTTPDPLYYTTRFIDGLRYDIRCIVMVQRPVDLDAARTLALLQEEALEPGHRHEFKKPDSSIFSKTATIKGALALPPPVPR